MFTPKVGQPAWVGAQHHVHVHVNVVGHTPQGNKVVALPKHGAMIPVVTPESSKPIVTIPHALVTGSFRQIPGTR